MRAGRAPTVAGGETCTLPPGGDLVARWRRPRGTPPLPTPPASPPRRQRGQRKKRGSRQTSVWGGRGAGAAGRAPSASASSSPPPPDLHRAGVEAGAAAGDARGGGRRGAADAAAEPPRLERQTLRRRFLSHPWRWRGWRRRPRGEGGGRGVGGLAGTNAGRTRGGGRKRTQRPHRRGARARAAHPDPSYTPATRRAVPAQAARWVTRARGRVTTGRLSQGAATAQICMRGEGRAWWEGAWP